MALIKEDGSIVANANSYADESDADAYLADRGGVAWSEADQDAKEATLIRATDYIESRFGLNFTGEPLGDVQELSWPRSGARYPRTGNLFPDDEVPVDVVNATILYANQIIGDGSIEGITELSVTPEIDSSGQQVTRRREKVDVLEEEVEYSGAVSGSTSLRTIRPIPDADRLVRRWLRGAGRGIAGLTVRAG